MTTTELIQTIKDWTFKNKQKVVRFDHDYYIEHDHLMNFLDELQAKLQEKESDKLNVGDYVECEMSSLPTSFFGYITSIDGRLFVKTESGMDIPIQNLSSIKKIKQ